MKPKWGPEELEQEKYLLCIVSTLVQNLMISNLVSTLVQNIYIKKPVNNMNYIANQRLS